MSKKGGSGINWSKDEGIALQILKWPVTVFDVVTDIVKGGGIHMNNLLGPGAAVALFIGLSRDAQQAQDYILPYVVAGGANYMFSPTLQPTMPRKGGGKR